MSDPYLIPGTACLANKLGISDVDELSEVEFRLVSIREVQVARDTLPGEYNLAHLQTFHHALFRDVYEWAGHTRTVNMSKENSTFAAWQFVQDETSAVLAGLERDNWLMGVQRERFIELLAHYYGELNARHPFREGNGRAQRAFLRQLAAAAGWRVDWSALSNEDNIAASKLTLLRADFKLMREVLDLLVVRM
ncbi:MAG TPA: Fic family protein [Pseudonocardiaceae bacterium]|nr:Fic family protein [Pseudonocardiaceae bacterium]